MRKPLVAFLLLFAALFMVVLPQTATAEVTSTNLFNSLGGTTTVDPGGSIHSQARSIYSFGGGMVSFQGKTVSLLAADPPSFSAGCSGISWHFGGFAFISMDDLRVLVESIAQASLGVAIDLAMHVLCPQCYAVMSKLRDLASMMRNAAANACHIAEMLGQKLLEEGGYSAAQTQGQCGTVSSDGGVVGSFMEGAMSVCKTVSGAMGTVATEMQKGMNWLNGLGSGSQAPSKATLNGMGNLTYETLTALGYPDGVLKDYLLSYTGMAIRYGVPTPDCRKAFDKMIGTVPDAATNPNVQAILKQTTTPTGTVQSSGGAAPTVANTSAASAATVTDSTSATIAPQTCFAPPLNQGIKDLARFLVCGFNPTTDYNLFASRYPQASAALESSAVFQMCSQPNPQNGSYGGTINGDWAGFFGNSSDPSVNPYVYHCVADKTTRCMEPQMMTLYDAFGAQASGEYTGLAWMIMDALYKGVDHVQKNQPWDAETLRIVNGTDYPLYRLINMAAVYPGLADDLIQSYSAIIAVQYALDTLNKMVSPGGGMPTIDTKASAAGIKHGDIARLQQQIANSLDADVSTMSNSVQQRMAQKRALVAEIVEVNRTMQAEVISQGLGGNANLAVSLKQQAAANQKQYGSSNLGQ